VTLVLTSEALAAADEHAVVRLAMTGDAAAFGELVRRRQSAIRNLFRRLTRDAALADDLGQQTFIQAWKSISTLRAPAAFGAWLRKLAVSCWLTHARRPLREIALDDDIETEAAGTSIAVQLDLDAALARLPNDVRLCVVLGYHEGMSHGEISHTTGIPLGTVKSHIARGSIRLRELLQEYGAAHE
jgi:RNA polymerase sigma factor (sigma-70 family)